MLLIPKAALTLGIATALGSGALFEAPAANAQVKIEVNIFEGPGFRYRDYSGPYLINYPGYHSYYYRGRDRRLGGYVRYRPHRNYSRYRTPTYRRSDSINRRETRVEPRFNTRDFYHRSW